MMNKKRIVSIVLVLVLLVAVVTSLVACGDKGNNNNNGGDNQTEFNITMWVSDVDGVKELFEQQVSAFNQTNGTWTINATVEKVSEGEAATQMISDVETGADIFCFAQDQLSRLVQVAALSKLGVNASATVAANNDPSAVAAATVGGDIYCYPLTSDNGYFMIYDKSIIADEHIESLEDILADCVAAGKTFNMDVLGSGWYNASFFFGAGCTSTWQTDTDGTFTAVNDTYNSANGVIAMKGMRTLLTSSAYNSSAIADEFSKNGAVVVTGTWGSADAQAILGDNYAVAKLPKFTVDGQQYQMGSYSGNKLMGVKSQQNARKAAALQALALYLTNEECQVQRFEAVGWGPSNISAQESDAVAADPTLLALAEQNQHAVPQGQIPNAWWDVTKTLAASCRDAQSDADIQAALTAYGEAVQAMANGTYVPDTSIRADQWAVIGSFYGDGWSKDIAMEKNSAGLWETTVPVLVLSTTEFKFRMGGQWGGDFGVGAANVSLSELGLDAEGLYYIAMNADTQEITMTPVTFGVIGDFNSWGADVAVNLVEGELISDPITFEANGGIKIRANADWTWSFGDNGENLAVTAGTHQFKAVFNMDTMTWTIEVVDAE